MQTIRVALLLALLAPSAVAVADVARWALSFSIPDHGFDAFPMTDLSQCKVIGQTLIDRGYLKSGTVVQCYDSSPDNHKVDAEWTAVAP